MRSHLFLYNKTAFDFASVRRFCRTVVLAALLSCVISVMAQAQLRPPIRWLRSVTNGVGQSRVWCVAYSPNGKLIAVGSRGSVSAVPGNVYLLNASDGSLSATTAAGEVRTLAFSPDGKTLAVGGNTSTGAVVELWGVADFKRIAQFLPSTVPNPSILNVAFSPNGKLWRQVGPGMPTPLSPDFVMSGTSRVAR